MGRYRIRPTTVGALPRGRDYSVRDLGDSAAGYTNMLAKELGVTLDADAGHTRYVQLHELSHVSHSLWSPKQIVKACARRGIEVTPEAVLAAEDARINERLLRTIPDAHEGFELSEKARTRLRIDLEGYVAAHATPPAVRRGILERLSGSELETVEALDRLLEPLSTRPWDDLSVWRTTVPLAVALTALQRERGGGKSGDEGRAEGSPSDDAKAESGRDGGDGDAKEPAGDGEAERKQDDEGGAEAMGGGEAEDMRMLGKPRLRPEACCSHPLPDPLSEGTWCIPTVEEPPLTVTRQSGNRARASADTGVAIRWQHAYRINTDGRIFARAARRPGALQRGTLLVDCSGSMSMRVDTLDSIIDAAPHATVMVYSGNGAKDGAVVAVVAREGRRVASDALKQYIRPGNTCDGPALLLLSRMPAPRLWICDGGTTGIGDSLYGQDECAAIMQAAGILQVNGTPLAARWRFAMCECGLRSADWKRLFRQIEKGCVEP